MKLNRKITVSIFLIAFLGFPIMMATNVSANPILAQEMETIEAIISDGAEGLFTYIDTEGRPITAYGQVGFPSDALNLDATMYDDCLAMALLSIKGETLDYLLTNLIPTLFGGSEPVNATISSTLGYTALQFGDGFSIDSILDILGDTFSLLITAYLDISETAANTRVSQVLAHLSGAPFSFAFSELISLRIDEAMIAEMTGGEGGIDLPFESIDLFIHKLETPTTQTINTILGIMDDDGLLGSIDQTEFTEASGSAAALVAIPRFELINDLIGGFGGMGTNELSPYGQFALAQNFTFDQPIAVAGAGYIGDQAIEAGDTELRLSVVVGASSFEPFTDANSIVICALPDTTNITGITPNTEGSFWNPNQTLIYWNATHLGTQPDYIIHFESDDFPPRIDVERTFEPDSPVTEAGTVDVTVTVTNNGDFPITDVVIDDSYLETLYPTLVITGSTTRTVSSITPDSSATLEYSVTFVSEGAYAFIHGEVSYTYEGSEYSEGIPDQSYTIASSFIDSIMNLIEDGWPYSGMALGIIGLGAVVNIALMRRGGGGRSGGVYQV